MRVNLRNSRLALIGVYPRMAAWPPRGFMPDPSVVKEKALRPLRPRRLCVGGVSVWLRLRRAAPWPWRLKPRMEPDLTDVAATKALEQITAFLDDTMLEHC